MLPPLVKPRLLITFLWDQLFSLPDPLLPHTLPHTRCAAANKLKNTAPQADALTHTPNKQTNNTHTHTTTSTTNADLLAHTRTAIVPTRLRTRGGIHCITIVQCRLFFFLRLATPALPRNTHTHQHSNARSRDYSTHRRTSFRNPLLRKPHHFGSQANDGIPQGELA